MELTPVQISLWDIEIKEKPKEIINKITPVKIEKIPTPLELTELQQKFLDKNSVMKNENLYRLIKYCGGGLGIELQLEEEFRTIYVNKEGHEEFTKDKKLPVLPMDKILYFKTADIPLNSLQKDKLEELRGEYPLTKIVKRKGDENIILLLEDKVISVNTKGWVLEFNNVEAAYLEDEVMKEEGQALQDIKIGDIIETTYGKEVIAAKVYSIYNFGSTLNIIWDKKHTAIPRFAVKKIIKCA
ncbi:hypothetical protein RBU49_06830 [Clostridium sp. MB40-C1]|uniref:hypothetical protein n=1 Tax=Clostridium sp. MB40-C1 TaxID=3070996 RepID=UPI0027E0A89F|nr:hypothetical protein [Clostridium sp. MB40-C1]WMJ81957.1 hypothetical protein RBU49_06830 [Clostridium sp. MB40-C1]